MSGVTDGAVVRLRRCGAARFAGAARSGELADAVRPRALVTVFAGVDFAAARGGADFFVADFFATVDFLVTFFAAVFRCGALRATLFFDAALRGAFRAAAFVTRLAGVRARADFVPVDARADFFVDLRAVLLLRWVGLIAVSGSASRAEVRRLRENLTSKTMLYSS